MSMLITTHGRMTRNLNTAVPPLLRRSASQGGRSGHTVGRSASASDKLHRDTRSHTGAEDVNRCRLSQMLRPERRTGVKRAEVITAWLVQDGRGWLRLSGQSGI